MGCMMDQGSLPWKRDKWGHRAEICVAGGGWGEAGRSGINRRR